MEIQSLDTLRRLTGEPDYRRPGSKRTLLHAIGMGIVCVWAVGPTVVQAEPRQEVLLAEDYFLNVPDMGEIPVDEFIETMGMFSSALGLNCADCHTFESSSSWAAYADETPIKRTARRMIRMVRDINQDHFGVESGEQPFVSCWTCHRGDLRPKVVPNLLVQYTAPSDDPNEVLFIPEPDAPSPAEIFDEYIEALGGAQALSNVTSIEATGNYNGFDTGFEDVPVEIYANDSLQFAMNVHARAGDSVRVYDGTNGWVAATDRAMPLLPLTGDTLDGVRIETLRMFPLGFQDSRNSWQMSYAIIDDRDVRVLRGSSPGQTPINLYFDDTGLLVRLLRFVDTPVGRIPTQIDFSDYREVAGVMMPFAWTSTWTNGRASVQLEEVRPNATIDAARFNEPPPSPPARAR